MDAKTFLETHGPDVATKVALRAGTKYIYFWQISKGIRRPGVDLALRLVDASNKEIKNPLQRLDFVSLLPPKSKKAKRAK